MDYMGIAKGLGISIGAIVAFFLVMSIFALILGVAWVMMERLFNSIRSLFSPSDRTPARAAQDVSSCDDAGQPRSFEIRTNRITAGDNGDGPEVIELEARGFLSVIGDAANITFITSVVDNIEGSYFPVISRLSEFTEPATMAYQYSIDVERATSFGLNTWERVGMVLPGVLVPPFGGARHLLIILRIIDSDNPPDIELGLIDSSSGSDSSGILLTKYLDLDHQYDGEGYQEEERNREKTNELAIGMAVAVAMSDGSLDNSEGEVIKAWIKKTIGAVPGQQRDEAKQIYNNTLRDAFAKTQSNELSLSDLTEQLNDIADDSQKLEAIGLCFDVMAADGVINKIETETIQRLSEVLELDYDEVTKIRDQRLIGLDLSDQTEARIEDILGIPQNASQDDIKQHLRVEFSKWNSRLTTLGEGPERDNAQRILNLIGEARKQLVD